MRKDIEYINENEEISVIIDKMNEIINELNRKKDIIVIKVISEQSVSELINTMNNMDRVFRNFGLNTIIIPVIDNKFDFTVEHGDLNIIEINGKNYTQSELEEIANKIIDERE